ncbi:PLxRFG domain-containing protein [Sulfitobacter sp. M22386]
MTVGAAKLRPEAKAEPKAEASEDTSPAPKATPKPKLFSNADRPMPDLSQIDYEDFDDKTREDGQNSPGKRKGRSETGRWARAVVKALKEAGFTETLNAKGKPQKAVSFGYGMRHEPDETKIDLTAPNGVELFVKMAATSMSRDRGITILVQFRGEPQKPGYSKPFLGGNQFLDVDLRPSEAAEKIINWAKRLDPKPKEAKKPAAQPAPTDTAPAGPLDPQPRGPRRMDWWWTNNTGQRRTALKAAGVSDLFPGQSPMLREVQDKLNLEQYEALQNAIFGPKEAEASKPSQAATPTPKPAAKQPAKPAAGLLSGLSDEKQARAAELKAKLAAKVRNQTSSGLDPEYITLGGELVALYIEGGAKKFGQMLRDFAETTGLSMREAQAPMRAAYNHVRDDMDLAGQDVSDMDDAATVMAEVRAALKEEDEASQNSAADPILEGEPANEGQDGTDTQQQDPRLDNPSVEGAEPGQGSDTGGRERSDERSDSSSSARDGEPFGNRDDLAGGMVGDVGGSAGDQTAERKGVNPGNFVIPDDFNLGAGTPGQKIEANIAAIRLVKSLQAENRHPTKTEQETLARYVGWGGLKRVFDPKEEGKTSQWGRAQADLRDLLTPDQYRAAAYSTAHAHYTSADVVGAMWGAMRGFGFDGGRALEPTVGTGNFVGMQPQDLAEKTEWYAAELDDITGAIAEYLYPDATVFAGQGFENAPFRAGSIDVAIGNPPFGSEILKSDMHPDIPPLSVHNYIIAKTGLLLRPGGIMGMVVTSRFLDTPNPGARSYLSKHFNFMGAVRLPNTAFKANAGTEVTTDIVWFQKRRDGDAKGDQSWLKTGVERDGIPMNGYFAANPDMMLGSPSMKGTMYGPDPEFTLDDDGRDLPSAMREAMGKIEGQLPSRETQLEDAVVAAKTTSDLGIGESLLTDDDRVMMRLEDDINNNAVVVELNAKSPWGPITHELMSASEAIEAAGQAIKNESVEVAEDAVKAALLSIGMTGAVTDKGTMKKSAPTGMGKEALNALATLHEGLSDENPYFGPAQKKALTALKKAVDAKRIGPKKFAALKGMLSLRRDTLALLAAEMRNDPKMEAMRKALRRQYRAFVKKHGYVNDPANDALVNGLPGAESALESKHRKANKAQGIEASAEEAAILSKRINTPYEPATKADSALDGIHISLRERGRLDMGLIADLTGKPMPKVIEELTGGEKPHVFYDPKRAEYVIADEYLSGNLADKIKEAQDHGAPENIPHLEAAMPEDKTAEQIVPSIRSMWMPGEVFVDFLRELGALKPKVNIDMKSANVDAQADGTPSDFGQMFQTERMNPFQIFTYAARGKSIVIYDRTHDGKQVKNEQATQDANAAAERMAEEFKKWAYMNAERKAAIVYAFNEKMNVVVPRKYDGVSYLTQVGANPEIELRNSQKNGAWRMMLSQSTLLHHVVGAGKTFTAITAIMERKRLGLSKKTLVAVPNHIVGQWARDFYALYPGANILAATEKDFTKANRRKLIARIATGDFDAVIVGHSSLRHIQNNVEETETLMQEQLGDLEDALAEAKRQGTSGRNVSQIAGRIKKYKEKMETELAKLKGDQMGFDFTAMGVDNLVIDEAHEFKNLEYSTAADRLVGMNSPDGSQRALDLYIKTRGLMARKGSVGFLTGTPVSNSLVEIYTVMKYLAPETLRSMNLMQYDAWASTFVQSKIRFEYTASQKLKERNVLAGLNNLGPLSDIYRSFADIVMRKEVEAMYKEQMEAENKKKGTNKPTRFPTPKVKNGGRQLVSLPSSPDQDEFTDYLVMRMGGIQANKSDKEYMKKDNALWVLSDARKASIDIRTVDPEAQRHEHSKVVAVGRDTLRLAKATEKDRGTQLIFADSSVPTKTAAGSVKAAIKAAWGKAGLSGPEATERMKKDAEAGKSWSEQWGDVVEAIETRMESGDLTEKQQEAIEEWMNGDDAADGAAAAFTADSGFSFYDDLKAYLVENGMDPEEIAFIHDYPKGDQKAGLFEAVNEGKVRVLIGSTFKMGAGTNAQERMVGLRHVDAPWRPSDMEQREGRIIRQGNKLYKADPEGFEVEITAYTTEKTSDVVLWQVLERKAAGIEQFLDANADTITEEDDSDADSYASFMAQSTGNPVFLRKMETEKAVRDKESEQSSMRMVVSEAKSFLDAYEGRMKREKRTIAAMDKVTFDAYPDAGSSWTQYKTDMRAYEQAKEAHEAEVEKVRKANKKLAKGEKRQKLPEFEQTPPQMFEGKLDAYSKRVRDAIREAIDKGESSKIKIGGGSLQVIRNDTKMEGVYSYFAEFEVEGQDYVSGVMRTGAVAKNPFNSRTLISAMMPDSVREAVRVNKRQSERQIERMEEAKPDMERKAKIQIDRTELNNLKRDLEMFKGMVRVAEVRNAQNRLGKTNRFAAMDDKGRSLELDKSDDAPLMPEGGASEFVFQNAGQTYRAAMGAKGGTFTKDGATTSIYWFEATDDDGNPALVQASQTTENQSSKDKKDGEAPKPAPLEVLDVFDTSQVEGAAEFRGGGADPAVTEDDVRALTKDMNAELKQSGLAGKVSVRVVKRLVSLTSGNEILGRFEADKGITVRAAGGVDERGIMRHEIIHALRSPTLWNTSHGLFTPAEWRGLVRAARADKGIRDNVLGRYADQPAAMQSEEMVAEMYRLWAADRDSYSGVETALAKIEAFLGALANLLRGRGFNSAAMTMQRIASGQVGGRGPTSPGGARIAAVAMQGAEMRAPAGAVREKFKGLVGSDHWKDPQGFISNKLSDAMAGKGDYSLLALVPGRPLFAELGKRLTAAQSYLKHKENMDQTRNDWHSRADTVSQRWLKARNKDPRSNDTLMDLMHRTTLAQVDPTQAYDGSDATWAKKEVARHGEHAPDWAHRKVAEDQRRRKSHRVLREIYDALPPAFQKLYKDIRAEYDAMGDDFEAAVLENVKHSMRVALKRARKEHKKAMQSIKDDGLTGREKADAVAEADEALRKAEQRNEKGAASKLQSLRAQFESNRLTGPYFPLARFGDYFVTVRDDDDQVISFAQFETEAKQQVHIKEMEAKHPGKVQHGLMNKKGALRDQVNPTFVADVEAMLADAEVDDQVLDAIWQRWLSTMPDQSIRTSKIHRKGRAGWNEDAFRAFGKHMFHGAHQLARLKHGVLLEEALDDARDEARVSENPNRAGALVNEMEKRHEFTMNPTGSSVVASMSSLAFLWYLGASPAAAIVNISQTTIVGTPIMAARFTKAGVNGSLSAITKATKDFGRGKGHVENSANLSADEKKAMMEAYQRGTIDKTQAHDLASVAETGIEYNAHREKWMRRIGWFFHNAERMNREVTFLANYRLARADGLSHAEAVDVGADMTWKIHFDYQNTARPRFMQNDLGKILTTFRQFTVNMLYRMFRDAHQALNGATETERREARAQLVGITLSMMAHAGIKGTWGYGIAMGLLALFLPGDSDDLEDWMQDALLMEGDDPATAAWNFAMGAALNGAPGQITGANLTERLGMPNLWFRGPGRELEGRDVYAHYVKELLGPVYGIGEGVVRGGFAVAEGDVVRGAESMIPKFIRDIVKTGRYAADGVETWNGDPIVEDVNPWELLLQANGFTPARVAERYEINNRLKNRERRIMDERKDIHKAASDAIASGGPIPEKVMDMVRDFNKRFPEYPITGQTIKQSFRGRQRAKQRNEYGISLNPKLNARLRGEVTQPLYN